MIKHYFPTEGNDVYIKQMHLDAGQYAETHKHNFDHFGLLGAGIADVECDGVKERKQGPCVIEIKAGVMHKISAITSIDWFCIHHSQETDVDLIDQILIKKD